MLTWLKKLFSDEAAVPVAHRAAANPSPATAKKTASVGTVPWRERDQVDYTFNSWLFDAEQQVEVFTNKNEENILAALDETVKSEQSGAHMVRRIPGVIPQLLQTLRNSEFSGAEVARTISGDLVLVAEVLRMANSAAYSPAAPISSIENAILLLGQNGLRQLITGVAFKPIINLKSGTFTRMVAPRLWVQSERCAFACRALAAGLPVDPLDAFLVGLIQNVGLTVSLRVIDQMSDNRLPVGSPTFCNALAMQGRTLAVNIAREWHFPEAVSKAILEQSSDPRDPKVSALGRILLMGDYLSKIDILVRNDRIDRRDRAITEDLSEKEIACLDALGDMEEKDWAAMAATGVR
ncbi:HDOD domain-containing protein [Noviherbaspirillum galbum]|uniref:HDOD domain-containing protein n=1 Tax=Noviherbaspirillum galbum TaxID=2709383 RepID=A0A6B3SI49_9BURK|nr:HDOD domain-containing protein [Noviherbaspirillum galbum]NEX60527.1 HDOD domain-containing protein [Noviherbaspirillum galbum]